MRGYCGCGQWEEGAQRARGWSWRSEAAREAWEGLNQPSLTLILCFSPPHGSVGREVSRLPRLLSWAGGAGVQGSSSADHRLRGLLLSVWETGLKGSRGRASLRVWPLGI